MNQGLKKLILNCYRMQSYVLQQKLILWVILIVFQAGNNFLSLNPLSKEQRNHENVKNDNIFCRNKTGKTPNNNI